MELARDEQVLFHGHPSWRSMVVFHLKGLAWAILAGVLSGLASAAVSGAVRAGWVILAVAVVFVIVIGRGLLARIRVTYTITSRRLTIETGLLARSVHQTHLEQIQNVNATQSPLGRLLGVGTVAFDTAGGAAFEFSFVGVDDPRGIVSTVERALRGRAPVRERAAFADAPWRF